ncbi:MAG: hypothetical protein Q8P70_02680 [bacterium]|nr:hypothetical protein [bacterium]
MDTLDKLRIIEYNTWQIQQGRGGEIVKIRLIVLSSLFIVGALSTFLFVSWIISMFLYALGDSEGLGAIAYTPRWIFLASPFVFLGGSRHVRKCLNGISRTLLGEDLY